MAYQCPRCSSPVQRGSNSVAGVVGGAIGGLLYAAFGQFQCKSCGPIPKSEFAPEVQAKMLQGSIVLGLVAVVILVAVIWLLGLK